MPARMTVERFWAKIAVGAPDECWPWLGSQTRDPYGKPSYGQVGWDGEILVVHRVVWVLTFGPIPDGLDVLHHCDNPPCCNPADLFLGTHSDNMRDRRDKGRHLHYPQRDLATGRWLVGSGVPRDR